MKKRSLTVFVLFPILLTALFLACSRDDDILATSKIKNITRIEFYNWLYTKKIPKDSILDSQDRQRDILTDMALQIFVLEKAKAEGFDKSKNIMLMNERARVLTLNNFFLNDITDRTTYNVPAIRVSYISLPLIFYKNDPDDKTKKIKLKDSEVTEKLNELTSRAKDIVKKLDAGDSFEKLASEFSDNSTKKSNGDIGYIIKDIMPDYFSEPAFRLKKGEYTKTPVTTPKGVYIIKVTDRVDLTEKNIETKIEDRKQRDRIKSRLLNKFKADYISRLMNADDVEFYYKKGQVYNDNDVIFKVGTRKYTMADLYESIEKRANQEEHNKIFKDGVIPDNEKFELAHAFFSYAIWSREALGLGIDKKPEYLKALEQLQNSFLIREYTAALASRSVSVSDKELKKEYDRGKNNRYSEKVMENGAIVKRPKPFDQVKEEIYNNIAKKIVFRKAMEWKEQVLKEYDFKINEPKLEGA